MAIVGYKPSKNTHFISQLDAKYQLSGLEEKYRESPADWRVLNNLANTYFTLGQTDKALELFGKAVELAPDEAVVNNNYALVLMEYAKFEQAYVYAEKSNSLDPTDQFNAVVFAELLLKHGQWRMGWDLYERTRFSLPQCPLPKYTGGPLSDGERQARILVLQEGGAGDAFMFFRFFECLKDLGAHVTFAVDPMLHCIFEKHPWVDRLISNQGVGISSADYDCWISEYGLGAIFASESPQVPITRWKGPYLASNNNGVISLRPKVGLCWRAGEQFENKHHRSMNLEQVKRITSSCPSVDWVCLQFPYGTPWSTPPPEPLRAVDLSTWENTADVIDSLDLIVTVDTGVMHLAAAIGKPVWTLLANSCWRFLVNGNECVWYPTMRLFRSTGLGYDTAIEKCCASLETWARRWTPESHVHRVLD